MMEDCYDASLYAAADELRQVAAALDRIADASELTPSEARLLYRCSLEVELVADRLWGKDRGRPSHEGSNDELPPRSTEYADVTLGGDLADLTPGQAFNAGYDAARTPRETPEDPRGYSPSYDPMPPVTPAGAVEAPSLTCLDCGEPVHLVHTVRHPNDYRATQHSARVASLTRSVERWQRIETAARRLSAILDNPLTPRHRSAIARATLRDALGPVR